MKKNKRIIGLITALLFSIIYTLFIKKWKLDYIIDSSTIVMILTNFLTILFIINVFFRIQSKNSQKSVAELKKRLIPSFILFVITTIFISLLIFSLGDYLLFLIKGWDTSNFFNILLQNEIPRTFIYLSIGIFIASVIFFYETWRQAIAREQKLREDNLKYKYINLKTQVNPHFLFNSLNTLSEIVYEDPKKADEYIQKLAGIYRYILDNEETDMIYLNKEIEFVKQYFELQKERNEDKIKLNIDIKNPENFKIIPISLQILVENALKHNSASKDKILNINIYQTNEYITVSNNIQKKSTLNNSTGIGLNNLKERIKLITGKDIIIDNKNNEFYVKLPLISI